MIKLPSNIEIERLIDDLRIFSWETSDIFLYYSKILKDSNYKSNILKNENEEDPVTLADLKVNQLIINRINEKYKDVNWEILSEENVKITSEPFKSNSDWLWILDPLDGTRDFIQGTSNYAMHLALTYKKKPYLGIVLIPEKEELWIAFGENVWCEKKDGSIKKTHFSKKEGLGDMVLVTSKNHKNKSLNKLIQKLSFKKVIEMGSIGCKIASIIRGESDIYISLSLPSHGSSPKDWDFAAPEAILKAAGGAITTLDNKDLIYSKTSYEQRGIIIASNNKKEHGKICLQLKEIIRNNKIFPLNS